MSFNTNDMMYGGDGMFGSAAPNPLQPQQQPAWKGFLQNTMQGMAAPQKQGPQQGQHGQDAMMNPGGDPQAAPLPKRGILGAMQNMGGAAAGAAKFFL